MLQREAGRVLKCARVFVFRSIQMRKRPAATPLLPPLHCGDPSNEKSALQMVLKHDPRHLLTIHGHRLIVLITKAYPEKQGRNL